MQQRDRVIRAPKPEKDLSSFDNLTQDQLNEKFLRNIVNMEERIIELEKVMGVSNKPLQPYEIQYAKQPEVKPKPKKSTKKTIFMAILLILLIAGLIYCGLILFGGYSIQL